uniref:Uncharacterized protein n=1 Tax=Anguilla anguilla TaxID=7936 RepID=A0A0E9WNP8_ANGAN
MFTEAIPCLILSFKNTTLYNYMFLYFCVLAHFTNPTLLIITQSCIFPSHRGSITHPY